jgi:hypothetical protein
MSSFEYSDVDDLLQLEILIIELYLSDSLAPPTCSRMLLLLDVKERSMFTSQTIDRWN